jgi:hypothetical protein
MNSFDRDTSRILSETYFGGSPHQQATGIKRHITFEDADTILGTGGNVKLSRGRGNHSDGEAFGAFDIIDKDSLGPAAREFYDFAMEVNSREPKAKGGIVKTASTDADSDLRKAFLRLFGHVVLTLYVDYEDPESRWVSVEDGRRLWAGRIDHQGHFVLTAPVRKPGAKESFSDQSQPVIEGLSIIAELKLDPRSSQVGEVHFVDQSKHTYMKQSGEVFSMKKTISELMGNVVMMVYGRPKPDYEGKNMTIISFPEDQTFSKK